MRRGGVEGGGGRMARRWCLKAVGFVGGYTGQVSKLLGGRGGRKRTSTGAGERILVRAFLGGRLWGMDSRILGCCKRVCLGLLIWAYSQYFLIGRGGILCLLRASVDRLEIVLSLPVVC